MKILKMSAGLCWEQYNKETVPTFKQLIDIVNKYDLNVNIELKGVTGIIV